MARIYGKVDGVVDVHQGSKDGRTSEERGGGDEVEGGKGQETVEEFLDFYY